MWSVAIVAFLASICLDAGEAYYGGMADVTPYYQPYSPFGGMNQGFIGGPQFMDDRSTGEPEILNCYASFLTPDGRGLANEIAVTIEQKDPENDWDHGMGFGMGVGMGMGMGFGMGANMGMHHDDHRGSGLSARVELISNVAGGKGYIVFTRTAKFNEGCGEGTMSDVLLPTNRKAMSGYGMGGYGMMGYGMDLGMIGYGMGFGMGHGGRGSMFDSDEDEGVVAEINVTPGALTSAVIDDIGFTDLKQLAGRGVLVCSNVDFDWDWSPTCEEPYYSCCNLKYDREGITLSDRLP